MSGKSCLDSPQRSRISCDSSLFQNPSTFLRQFGGHDRPHRMFRCGYSNRDRANTTACPPDLAKGSASDVGQKRACHGRKLCRHRAPCRTHRGIRVSRADLWSQLRFQNRGGPQSKSALECLSIGRRNGPACADLFCGFAGRCSKQRRIGVYFGS